MTTVVETVMLWASLMQPIAQEAGVDWRVGLAIIYVESEGQPKVGDAQIGVGLMGVRTYFHTERQLRYPETNLTDGCAMLRVNMDETPDLRHALVAYHMGYAGAAKAGWLSSQDGGDYLARFEAAWRELWPGQALPWARSARPSTTGEREE